MDLGARLGVIFEVSLGMKKLLGILVLGLLFCNISFAEIMIESKRTKDGRFYNERVGTVCVDGYKFVVWGSQGTSMVQFFEERDGKSLPAKC